jgi:hypothetical protein
MTALTLPKSPPSWSQVWQTRLNQTHEISDLQNRKKGTDVIIEPGAKLIMSSPNGTAWQITVSDAGVIGIVGGGGAARKQRAVTTSPIMVTPTDEILNCNIPAVATCTLPLASSRNGAPLTFKDLGQASTHNITITPAGSDHIDGLTSITLNNNYQAVTLVPFNDGVNSGWSVE